MNTTNVLILLVGVALGALSGWLAMRSAADRAKGQVRHMEASVEDVQREKQKTERELREEIRALASEQAEAIKTERAKAFEEGRKLGQAEGERERILELTTKQKEFDETLRSECKRVADDARDQARMQFEQQQKLFSVKVSPYVEVKEVGTYLTSKYERQIGYQYQLLVNGIPAFKPHVIVESTEFIAKTKDENIEKLADRAAQVAQQAAQGAIETFLGGAGAFVKLGKVIRRLPGTGQ
jgi:hypothetical protein